MYAVGARVHVPGGAFPGVDETIASVTGVTREELLHLERRADGTYTMVYHLTLDDPDRLEDVLASDDEVIHAEILDAGGRWYCFVHVTEPDEFFDLIGIADEHALVIERPIQFVDGGIQITVAGQSESLQAAFEKAAEAVDVRVEWSGGYDPAEPDVLARLTERQREAIQAAYDLGFYEKPRRATYEEIADALECAPSTANELLRRAETTIVAAVLDE